MAALFTLVGAYPAAASAHGVAGGQIHAASISAKQLGTEVANYAALLTNFGDEISRSSSLSAAHVSQLTNLAGDADQQVNNLIGKVQIDTSSAALQGDAAAIARLAPMFALLSAQVYLTIEADSLRQRYDQLSTDKWPLQGAFVAITGSVGYSNALSHYHDLLDALAAADRSISPVAATVLAQRLSGFPKNEGVLRSAASQLDKADAALAQAEQDETVVALSFGGYRGN